MAPIRFLFVCHVQMNSLQMATTHVLSQNFRYFIAMCVQYSVLRDADVFVSPNANHSICVSAHSCEIGHISEMTFTRTSFSLGARGKVRALARRSCWAHVRPLEMLRWLVAGAATGAGGVPGAAQQCCPPPAPGARPGTSASEPSRPAGWKAGTYARRRRARAMDFRIYYSMGAQQHPHRHCSSHALRTQLTDVEAANMAGTLATAQRSFATSPGWTWSSTR